MPTLPNFSALVFLRPFVLNWPPIPTSATFTLSTTTARGGIATLLSVGFQQNALSWVSGTSATGGASSQGNTGFVG